MYDLRFSVFSQQVKKIVSRKMGLQALLGQVIMHDAPAQVPGCCEFRLLVGRLLGINSLYLEGFKMSYSTGSPMFQSLFSKHLLSSKSSVSFTLFIHRPGSPIHFKIKCSPWTFIAIVMVLAQGKQVHEAKSLSNVPFPCNYQTLSKQSFIFWWPWFLQKKVQVHRH